MFPSKLIMDQNKIPRSNIVLSRWFTKFNSLPKATQGTLLLGLLAGVIVLLGLVTQGQPIDPNDSFIDMMVNVSLKLIIVLLLIFTSAMLLKRFGIASFQTRTRNMKIVETLSLSPKRSLYIVRVGNQSLLLGATDQSINLIKEMDALTTIEEEETTPIFKDFN